MKAHLSFKNGDTLNTNIEDRYTPDLLANMMIAPTGNSIICEDNLCGYRRINIINLAEIKLIQLEPES